MHNSKLPKGCTQNTSYLEVAKDQIMLEYVPKARFIVVNQGVIL